MKRLLPILLLFTALATVGQVVAQDLRSRAGRSYDWGEYPSAAAMYELVLRDAPADTTAYVRAIVSQQMLADSVAATGLLQRAMGHGISMPAILRAVRQADFDLARADLYPLYLSQLRTALPWMSRAIDDELLSYYAFRHDGPATEALARRMLAGLPDDAGYLNTLAQALLLQGRIDEAREVWAQIITLDPADSTARTHLEATSPR